MKKIVDKEMTGLGEGLVEVLPKWEYEIFWQWKDGLRPLYDTLELQNDNEKAVFYILTLPKMLKNMAFLCGSNGAGMHGSALMRLRERLLPILAKLADLLPEQVVIRNLVHGPAGTQRKPKTNE